MHCYSGVSRTSEQEDRMTQSKRDLVSQAQTLPKNVHEYQLSLCSCLVDTTSLHEEPGFRLQWIWGDDFRINEAVDMLLEIPLLLSVFLSKTVSMSLKTKKKESKRDANFQFHVLLFFYWCYSSHSSCFKDTRTEVVGRTTTCDRMISTDIFLLSHLCFEKKNRMKISSRWENLGKKRTMKRTVGRTLSFFKKRRKNITVQKKWNISN
jgi:hypothetical protein